MLEKIRAYINRNYIGNNRTLVKALEDCNSIYKSPQRVSQRALRVAGLFWKYVILKRNPLAVRERKRKALAYPEGAGKNGFDIKEFEELSEGKNVVIDFLEVLYYPALSTEQLYVLLETIAEHPGLALRLKEGAAVPPKYEEKYREICTDFLLKNDTIFSLIARLRKGKGRVFIRNNCTGLLAEVAEHILQDNHLELWREQTKEEGPSGQGRKGRWPGEVRKERWLGEVRKERWPMEGSNTLYLTAGQKGWGCIPYTNVNRLAGEYRPFFWENTAVGLYNRLVNLRLHSSRKAPSFYYEYGFTCGGILACGFSQFLNKLAQREKIEKLIFVARDGEILHKVYKKYFHQLPSSYLMFSRAASFELIFEDFPQEYVDKNIKARIYRNRQDNSVRRILRECGISPMESYLAEDGINLEERLTEDNYLPVRESLLKHPQILQEIFQPSCDSAREYFLKEVEGYKKVCIVDLGWHGKSTVCLKHLLEKKYGWQGQVMGAQIGACLDPVTRQYIQSGLISCYAFENDFFRKMGSINGQYMEDEEILCVEALFSSASPTLLRYGSNEKEESRFIFAKVNTDGEKIREIHQGILDFSRQFVPFLKKYHLQISGRDAYTPLDCLMESSQARELILKIYENDSCLIHSHGD